MKVPRGNWGLSPGTCVTRRDELQFAGEKFRASGCFIQITTENSDLNTGFPFCTDGESPPPPAVTIEGATITSNALRNRLDDSTSPFEDILIDREKRFGEQRCWQYPCGKPHCFDLTVVVPTDLVPAGNLQYTPCGWLIATVWKRQHDPASRRLPAGSCESLESNSGSAWAC